LEFGVRRPHSFFPSELRFSQEEEEEGKGEGEEEEEEEET
jgi:hypothetical protein